jgi:hypothetical protein
MSSFMVWRHYMHATKAVSLTLTMLVGVVVPSAGVLRQTPTMLNHCSEDNSQITITWLRKGVGDGSIVSRELEVVGHLNNDGDWVIGPLEVGGEDVFVSATPLNHYSPKVGDIVEVGLVFCWIGDTNKRDGEPFFVIEPD